MIQRLKQGMVQFWRHHKLLTILIGIILLSLAVRQFGSIISIESFRSYIDSFGPTAPILFIALYAVGRMLPVVGAYTSPLFFSSILIFHPLEAISYVLVADFIGTTMNFVLARRFGYEALSRILKSQHIREIKKASSKLDTGLVVVFRILPVHVVGDVVSYAAGMSNMKWKKFILATMLAWTVIITISLYSYNYFLTTNNGIFLLPWHWIITFPVVYYILKSRTEYKTHLQHFFHHLNCWKYQLSCELRGKPVLKKW